MKITKKIIVWLCVLSFLIGNIVAYADILGVGHDMVTGEWVNGEYIYTPTGNRYYDTVTITKGTETRFHLAAQDTSAAKVEWTVGDTNILQIEKTTLPNVKIKAVGVGSTTLYAYKFSYATATGQYNLVGMCSIPITVSAHELISINLSYPEVYLNVGESIQNSVVGWYPVSAEIGDIVWSSSNNNIATVSANGLITGVSEGSTTIYAKSNGITEPCTVIVESANQGNNTGFEDTKSGKVGNNVYWNLENDVLILSGTGNMYDYAEADFPSIPWSSEVGKIKSIVIGEGITNIGSNIFSYCQKLLSVQIPNSVTTIGEFAFAYCYELPSIEIPDGVTTIGDYAFLLCNKLSYVEIYDSIKSIGFAAFPGCLSELVYNGNELSWNEIDIDAGNGDLISVVTFTETSYIPVTSMALNTSKTTMNIGETRTLKATVYPSNASNKTVLWSSSNTSVATVSTTGVVTAVGKGTATITAKTEDGNYTDTCSVVVNAPTLQKVSAPVASVSSGNINKGSLVSLATETDGATIYYTIDGSTPTATSLKYTQSISINDSTTINAYAVKEGMEDSAVVTFTYTIKEENEDKPTISISDKKGKIGDTVSLTLDISDNPGIAGMILKLGYDEGLTLTDISAGTALSTLTFTPPANVSKNPCTLLWDGITEDNSNGTVLTLNFKISDTAPEGEYNVSVSYTAGDIYNDAMEDIELAIDNGIVTVYKYRMGDVNEDDIINAKDITLLRKYISGDYGVTVNEDAADVNKDGVLNAKDITVLRKFVSGDYGIVLE